MIKFERHNYESCKGLTLWVSKTKHIEVWFCPKGYEIIPHAHPEENIELMYLYGKTTFYRKRNGEQQSHTPRWYHFGRKFSVLAGDIHWFTVSLTRALVFVNIATFLPGYAPKSASVDFQPIK